MKPRGMDSPIYLGERRNSRREQGGADDTKIRDSWDFRGMDFNV